jgi:hypothetical protein
VTVTVRSGTRAANFPGTQRLTVKRTAERPQDLTLEVEIDTAATAGLGPNPSRRPPSLSCRPRRP